MVPEHSGSGLLTSGVDKMIVVGPYTHDGRLAESCSPLVRCSDNTLTRGTKLEDKTVTSRRAARGETDKLFLQPRKRRQATWRFVQYTAWIWERMAEQIRNKKGKGRVVHLNHPYYAAVRVPPMVV